MNDTQKEVAAVTGLFGALIVVALVGWLVSKWSPKAGGVFLLAIITVIFITNSPYIVQRLNQLRGV